MGPVPGDDGDAPLNGSRDESGDLEHKALSGPVCGRLEGKVRKSYHCNLRTGRALDTNTEK